MYKFSIHHSSRTNFYSLQKSFKRCPFGAWGPRAGVGPPPPGWQEDRPVSLLRLLSLLLLLHVSLRCVSVFVSPPALGSWITKQGSLTDISIIECLCHCFPALPSRHGGWPPGRFWLGCSAFLWPFSPPFFNCHQPQSLPRHSFPYCRYWAPTAH